jgi:hypothetical protein
LLPVPEFAGLKQDVLAIVADGDAMTVASPADRVRPSAVPAWMSPRLRPLEAAVFRGRGRSWQLAAATAGPNAADLKVPFLETCIWLGGSDVEYGSTLAFVAPAGQPHVSFRWPQGILLRSLHVNGRAVTATVTEGRLNVPLDSSLDFVRIDWERKTGTGPRRIGRDSVEFPSPASTNGTPSLVTIVPAQRQSVFRIRGIETLEAIDYALRRIELLLEIADGHPPGQSAAATSAVEAAGRAYRGLTQFLKSPSANAQVLDDDVRQRLGRIDAALEEQKRKAESGKKRIDSAFRLPPSAFDSAPQIDGMHYGELHPADVPPEVAFWHIDRWLLAGLLAAATLLVTLPFARPLFRAEIGERLTHWEPVSWIVLGTVWWLFLVPSAVGLLLFSVAVAKLVRRWLRRRTSGNVIRLYELSKSGDRRSGTTR